MKTDLLATSAPGTATHHIRPAQPTDAEGISALLHGMGWFAAYEGRSAAQNAEAVRALLDSQADAKRSLFLVAEDAQQRIHGYCAVHWLPAAIFQSWEAYVSELFVADAARGLGLGSRLLDTAVQAARQQGCLRIWLVNNRQRTSYERGFYAKLGWSEQAQMARFVLPLAPL